MKSLTFENGCEVFRPADKETFSIAVTGDICPARVTENGPRPEDAKRIYSPFDSIFSSADLRVCQWETPLTDSPDPIDKSGPNLIAPSAFSTYLTAAKFDVALLANNHTGDQNDAALIETMKRLDAMNIAHVGAGLNEEDAKRVLLIERNGFTIGIINGCEHEFGTAEGGRPGANAVHVGEFCKCIADTAKKADITLVVLHGGNETNPVPSPRMVRMCRSFADMGASAVINIHTHCPQGIELHNGVPILYCPGNFFFPWPVERYDEQSFWWVGYLPVLTFDRQGAVKLEIHPFRLSPNPWKMELFDEAARTKFFAYMAEISAPLANLDEVRKYFDAWCVRMGGMFGIFGERCPGLKFEPRAREEIQRLLPVRNLCTCEAHHELVSNALRMMEQYRFAAAPGAIEQIEKWQKADF